MRPPRAIPLLTLIALALALALPAGAQTKTKAGADATASGSGRIGSALNAGGVAPIGFSGSAPLSPGLAPALSGPALSPDQGLAPSALASAARPAAASPEKAAPKAAASVSARLDAGPNAAPAGPPAGAAHFVQSLAALGVPSSLTSRLEAFLAARHPGDQDKIYHGLGHSHEVADLTARIVSEQELSPEKKIMLILSAALHDVDPKRTANTPARVSATLGHLDSDDEARGLLVDFGSRYGFTAAQVKALIMATDFAMDPVQMQVKQDAFARAAKEAFPAEPDWGLNWGKRLAFIDQSSTYVGSLAGARKRVEGLGVEIRAQLEEIGKGPGPSNGVILAGTYKFLTVLKQNPLFALLPAEQRRNFDGVLAYFLVRQTPEAWLAPSAPAPARAPPVVPDIDAALLYIKGITGGRVLAPSAADTLLGDWLDEQGIDRGSARAADIRRSLVPAKVRNETDVASKLKPSLRRHAALLIRIAAEHGVSVPYVESVLVKRGLLQYLQDLPEATVEDQIETALANAALERAVSAYPDNEQGELMRAVVGLMGAKSGNSVEEIAREGVFIYADFSGARFVDGYASREPDIQDHTIVFYVIRADGKWRIDGYRQKARNRKPDASYIDGLKAWLTAGGIPPSDFH